MPPKSSNGTARKIHSGFAPKRFTNISCAAAPVDAFIASNLKKIIEEASSAEYRDRFGTLLSPAPLRSVAVSAAKALMELYPIKERGGNNSNNNGESDTNITFNVIVPGQTNDKE